MLILYHPEKEGVKVPSLNQNLNIRRQRNQSPNPRHPNRSITNPRHPNRSITNPRHPNQSITNPRHPNRSLTNPRHPNRSLTNPRHPNRSLTNPNQSLTNPEHPNQSLHMDQVQTIAVVGLHRLVLAAIRVRVRTSQASLAEEGIHQEDTVTATAVQGPAAVRNMTLTVTPVKKQLQNLQSQQGQLLLEHPDLRGQQDPLDQRGPLGQQGLQLYEPLDLQGQQGQLNQRGPLDQQGLQLQGLPHLQGPQDLHAQRL